MVRHIVAAETTTTGKALSLKNAGIILVAMPKMCNAELIASLRVGMTKLFVNPKNTLIAIHILFKVFTTQITAYHTRSNR